MNVQIDLNEEDTKLFTAMAKKRDMTLPEFIIRFPRETSPAWRSEKLPSSLISTARSMVLSSGLHASKRVSTSLNWRVSLTPAKTTSATGK